MTNILIIDDDPQIRMMLSELLEREDYRVDVVSNGFEALEQFGREKPDLIITDVVMPDMDGLELMLRLRKQQPGLKVVAISGGARIGPESYLKLADKLGADATVAKPMDIVKLLDTVKELVAA
ncbi:response regulator [Desulfoplanes sp.]